MCLKKLKFVHLDLKWPHPTNHSLASERWALLSKKTGTWIARRFCGPEIAVLWFQKRKNFLSEDSNRQTIKTIRNTFLSCFRLIVVILCSLLCFSARIEKKNYPGSIIFFLNKINFWRLRPRAVVWKKTCWITRPRRDQTLATLSLIRLGSWIGSFLLRW